MRLTEGHNTVTPLRLEPVALWSQVNHSTTEPLRVNTDSQWSKQEACFARVTQVWLAVNHNTSVTSGE